MRRALPVTLVLLSLLSGCDQLGIETPKVTAEKKEADGKAIGAACRHAGRAIEDCYTLNKRAEKAAIYAGWREMDDYMRENKIEPVPPVIKPEEKKPKPPEGEDAAGDDAGDGKAAASEAASGKESSKEGSAKDGAEKAGSRKSGGSGH